MYSYGEVCENNGKYWNVSNHWKYINIMNNGGNYENIPNKNKSLRKQRNLIKNKRN